MNKIIKIKEPIRIRFKKLKNGNKSIYLDFYKNGNREYEFLNLYLIPETTPISKITNKETLEIADAVKARKVVELKNLAHDFSLAPVKSKGTKLLPYIDMLAVESWKRTGTKQGNYYNYKSLRNHLKVYKGENISFAQVTENYIKGFIKYLRNADSMGTQKEASKLSPNTQNKLYNKLKCTLDKAVREDIITTNPMFKIDKSDKPKTEASKREYLTIKEVKKLIETDCKHNVVKRSFLFSCLTGLRYGDISKLKWENLHTDNFGAAELRFKMRKTRSEMTLQVSNEALKWLPTGTTKEPTDRVFKLPKNEVTNPILKEWVKNAGIRKDITFHCSRHTAATLSLTLGNTLEVTSKLLGHSKISTTQIYAQIVSKAKREAVDKQNGIFD
ncbi:MAG: site-specific integrase [Bacteroidetes bacterium]|nr:site-specific integrase [Bacteroidota bacterium]